MQKNSMDSLTGCPCFHRGAQKSCAWLTGLNGCSASNSTQFPNPQWCVSVCAISPLLLVHLNCRLYQSMPLLVLDRWSKFRIAAACIELEITKFVPWCLCYHHHSNTAAVCIWFTLSFPPLASSMCLSCIVLSNEWIWLIVFGLGPFLCGDGYFSKFNAISTSKCRCRWLFDSYKLCSAPYNLYIINIYRNIDCTVLFYWLYPCFLTLIFATFCVVLLFSCTLCTIAGNTISVFFAVILISILYCA